MRPTADEIVARLGLEPHVEGVAFRETYRNADGLGTSIVCLVGPRRKSLFHRLTSDEMWHFYAGDPIELYRLGPSDCDMRLLGSDPMADQDSQVLVPAGAAQGARLVSGGAWALLGATVWPAFRYEDYSEPTREDLLAEFPAWRDAILDLTR